MSGEEFFSMLLLLFKHTLTYVDFQHLSLIVPTFLPLTECCCQRPWRKFRTESLPFLSVRAHPVGETTTQNSVRTYLVHTSPCTQQWERREEEGEEKFKSVLLDVLMKRNCKAFEVGNVTCTLQSINKMKIENNGSAADSGIHGESIHLAIKVESHPMRTNGFFFGQHCAIPLSPPNTTLPLACNCKPSSIQTSGTSLCKRICNNKGLRKDIVNDVGRYVSSCVCCTHVEGCQRCQRVRMLSGNAAKSWFDRKFGNSVGKSGLSLLKSWYGNKISWAIDNGRKWN